MIASRLTRFAHDRQAAVLARQRQVAAEQRAAGFAAAIRNVRRAVQSLQSGDLRTFLGTSLSVMVEQLDAPAGGMVIMSTIPSSWLALRFESGRLVERTDDLVSLLGRPGGAFRPSTIGKDISMETTAPSNSGNRELDLSEQLRAYLRSRGAGLMVGVPVTVDDQPVGMFALGVASSWRLRPEDRELLEVLASHASVAVRLARVAEDARAAALAQQEQQAVRIRAESLDRWRQRVHRALESLAASAGVDAALGEVLSEAARQFGAVGGSIWHAEANGIGRLLLSLENGQLRDAGASDNPGFAPVERVPHIRLDLRRGEVRLDDEATIRTHPDYAPFRDFLARAKVRSVAVVAMYLGESFQGALTLRFSEDRRLTADESVLLEAFANQAVFAGEVARLSRAARTAAVDDERTRLARDVHDTVAQGLTAIVLRLQRLGPEQVNESAMRHIRAAIDIARSNLAEARRSIRGLRPALCDGLRFDVAIEGLVENSRALSSADIRLKIRGRAARIPSEVESELLLIVREALTNTVKHSAATSVTVDVSMADGMIRVDVRDDGVGFDSSRVAGGVGLTSIHERAQKIGATVAVTSEVGHGTLVSMYWSVSGPKRSWTNQAS